MGGDERRARWAGVAAQAAGLLWVLQWAHVLVTHGPGEHDGRGMWLGLTWMDSAKFLAAAYLLLIPAVRYIASRPAVARRRWAMVFGRLTVAALVVAATATAVEFRVWEWQTYAGTFNGRSSVLWVAGPIRSITSAVVLSVGFAAFGVVGARARVLPFWLPPLLVVAALSTVFIGGPIPPLAGLVWLALGGWLLTQGRSDPAEVPHSSTDPARATV